jgi:hypothetical protein
MNWSGFILFGAAALIGAAVAAIWTVVQDRWKIDFFKLHAYTHWGLAAGWALLAVWVFTTSSNPRPWPGLIYAFGPSLFFLVLGFCGYYLGRKIGSRDN